MTRYGNSQFSLGANCSAHPPSLKMSTPVQVNVSRINKGTWQKWQTSPAHTSRILWQNKFKMLSGIESSLCFNVLTCTRQKTPPEWGRGEEEYSNQHVQCFTDDHHSKIWAYTQQSSVQPGRARLEDHGTKCNAVFHFPLLLNVFLCWQDQSTVQASQWTEI
jgi:hypothetical protein